MIQCRTCKNWFHGRCVGLSEDQDEDWQNLNWFCKDCDRDKNEDSHEQENTETIEEDCPENFLPNGEEHSDDENVSKDKKDFKKCSRCGQLIERKDYKVHMKTHSNRYKKLNQNKLWTECHLCPKLIYGQNNKLKYHYANVHYKKNLKPFIDEKLLSCNLCGKSFSKLQNAIYHVGK